MTCRSTSRASRSTWTSQRSTSASYLPRIAWASSSRARAALTSAAATSHFLLGEPDLLLVVLDGRLLRPPVLAQLGHEEVGEHVALLHLVADVDVPLLDECGQLRIDRRALVALDEARLPDDADDLPELGMDHLKDRRLRDARGDLLLLGAARRREDGQEPEPQPAAASGSNPSFRPKGGLQRSSPVAGETGRTGPSAESSLIASLRSAVRRDLLVFLRRRHRPRRSSSSAVRQQSSGS